MTALDFSILDGIKDIFSNDFFDVLMPLVSSLGNFGAIWIISGLVLMLFPRYRKSGLYVLLALLAGFIICNLFLKPLIARPRPCWIRPEVPLLIPVPYDFSFPSGHTVSAFAAAEALRQANRKFGYVAYPLAFLIAFSRLYLYVHFPSDVLAGALIGFICGFFVPKILSKNKRRGV